MAKSRAPLIAMIAAGLSLVVAAVAVIVVVTRTPPAPPAPTGPIVDDGEISAADFVAGKLVLSPDDKVLSIDGEPLDPNVHADAVLRVVPVHRRGLRTLYIEVERDGTPVLIRRRITGDLAAEYRAAHPAAPMPNISTVDLDPALIDSAIHELDDTTYEIDRALVDKVLADPMTIAKGARVVPAVKNGVADGFKLYAIRPDSLYAKLGLANGDTIQVINGFDLTSDDKALELYTKLKDAKSLTVGIMRRGKPVTLHYTIK